MSNNAVLCLMLIAPLGWALHIWAESQCTKMDVLTGRREHMALYDNYGSNRGWYWRYKIPSLIGVIICAPGTVMLALFALIWLASN